VVLSLFVIAGLFNWLVASHRMILGLYNAAHYLLGVCLWPEARRSHGERQYLMVLILLWKKYRSFAGRLRLC